MYFCCCFVLTRIKPHICTNWLWSWGTSEKACDSQKALSESQPIMIWDVLSRMLFLYVYNRYTYLFCCNLLNTQAHTPVFCCLPLYNMVRDFLVFFKDLRSPVESNLYQTEESQCSKTVEDTILTEFVNKLDTLFHSTYIS